MAFLEKTKNRIVGGCRMSVPAANSASFLNICMENHIPYNSMCTNGNILIIDMTARAAARVIRELENEGTEYKSEKYGLPFFLLRYRRRYGLMVGGIIIFLMIYLSGRVVWDIRVSGNRTLTEAQVESELAAQGFGIGSKIGGYDVDTITNRVLRASGKISWMTINFRGTVAEVQIREKELPPERAETNAKANVVAARNGIIDRVEVLRGQAAVKEGDSVNEGDLLITGVIDTKYGSFRTESALGRVFAVTTHTFNIEIPLEYEENEQIDTSCTGKYIIFFSKRINIFGNSGKTDANCVKIEKEEYLSLPGLPRLPVGIVTELSQTCKKTVKKRTYADASRLAFFELNNLIADKLSAADLLEKTVKTEMTDTVLTLVCTVVCSEDIAKIAPFE